MLRNSGLVTNLMKMISLKNVRCPFFLGWRGRFFVDLPFTDEALVGLGTMSCVRHLSQIRFMLAHYEINCLFNVLLEIVIEKLLRADHVTCNHPLTLRKKSKNS